MKFYKPGQMYTRGIVRNFFTDKNGHLKIYEKPNAPIMVWFAAAVMGQLTHGDLATIFSLIATISIVIWATLEIFAGSSPFRRFMGIVIVAIVVTRSIL